MPRDAALVDADAEWVAGILATVEYLGHDGWEFELDQSYIDGITLIVRAHLPCVHNDFNTVTITQWAGVDKAAERRDVRELMRSVEALIARIEGHERLERLLVGGRPAFDPHPIDPRIPRWHP